MAQDTDNTVVESVSIEQAEKVPNVEGDEIDVEYEARLVYERDEYPQTRDTETPVRKYRVEFVNNETQEQRSVPFWGSVHDYRQGEHASLAEALDCVVHDMLTWEEVSHEDKYEALDRLSQRLGTDAGETAKAYDSLKKHHSELDDIGVTLDVLRLLLNASRDDDGEVDG